MSSNNDIFMSKQLKGHTKTVTDISFHPELNQFASASEDTTLIVWKMEKNICSYKYAGHSDVVTSVRFSPNGELIVSSSKDNTVRFWVPKLIGNSTYLKAHTSAVNCVEFCPLGKQIVTGSNDKSLKLWDASNTKFITSLTGHNNWVTTTKYSSKFIASGANDRTVRIWDPNSGHCEHIFSFPKSNPTKVAVHNSHDYVIAVAMDSGSVRIYDIRIKKLLQHYTLHDNSTCVSWHPNANYFSSCGGDGKIRIVDVMEGRPLYTLSGHDGYLSTCKFNSDGTKLATAGLDHIIMIWQLNF